MSINQVTATLLISGSSVFLSGCAFDTGSERHQSYSPAAQQTRTGAPIQASKTDNKAPTEAMPQIEAASHLEPVVAADPPFRSERAPGVTNKFAFKVQPAVTSELQRTAEDLPPSPEEIESGAIDASSRFEEGVSLDLLESIALNSHPDIAVARAQTEEARGRQVQAGLPFNPTLFYQNEEIGTEDASGLRSLSVSQQVVTADKLELARRMWAEEIDRRQAQRRRVELAVLTRVRAAFAQALLDQQRVELTDQILELAQTSLELVQTLLEAQEISRIELLQARIEAQQAQIGAENAKTQLQASLGRLAAAAGLDQLPQPRLAGDPEADVVARPWQELLREITVASPELAASAEELDRARWALRLAFAQVVPNVTAQVGVGHDSVGDDTFARWGVSVPLPIRNRNQGNIRSARADVAAAVATIESTQRSLQRRFADAIGRYETARQRYQRLQEEIVPSAEESYDLSLKAFDVGETDYLQLLTTQRTLFQTRLRVLDTLFDAKQAQAEIEGLLVEQVSNSR